MKQNFIKQLLKMTRYALYGMFIQCLLFSFMLAGNSNAQRSLSDVQVSIDMKKVTLASAFGQLSAQTGFEFVYDHAKINLNKKIDVNVAGSLEKALMTVSKDANVQFKRINDNIFVSKRTSSTRAVSEYFGKRTDVAISGKVTGADNSEGLPGASVVEKGTTNGVVTDLDGNYKLTVSSPDPVLVISFVGYQTQEVAVESRSVIDIALSLDATQLDEIVVIGYGEQSREATTSSISTVNADNLQNIPVSANAAVSLIGKAAGVTVVQTDGRPEAGPRIWIRGGTDTDPTNDGPLYVVDGIIRDNMSDINMSDISTFNILKDAASTSIYGARAANGVVLITTKSGKKGAGKLTFKYGFEAQNIDRYKQDFLPYKEEIYYSRIHAARSVRHQGWTASYADNLLNASWYGTGGSGGSGRTSLQLADDVRAANGGTLPPSYITIVDPVYGNEIAWEPWDWQDQVFKDGSANTYNLDYSGGSDKMTYYMSLNYYNNNGVAPGTSYDRISLTNKMDFKINDKLKAGSNIQYTYADLGTGGYDGSGYRWFERAGRLPSTVRYANSETGELVPGNSGKPNPDYWLQNYTVKRIRQKTVISTFLEYEILEGLKFKPFASIYREENTQGQFRRKNAYDGRRYASGNNNSELNTQFDLTINYFRELAEGHTLDVLAGTSFINEHLYILGGSTFGAATDLVPTLNAGSNENDNISSELTNSAVQSWFGRASYNYNDKYLLSLSMRRDGASNFSQNFRWANFPGLSAGWNIHNEGFWNSSLIDRMKLRASWGKTGKNQIDIYDSQGLYAGNQYKGNSGVLNTRLANNNLKWETTTSYDIGLDLSLLDSRLSILVDYYYKDSHDRLYNKSLPSYSGFGAIRTNFGTFINKGIEVEIDAIPYMNDELVWDVSFNYSYNNGKVGKLPDNGKDKNREGGFEMWDGEELIFVGGLAEGERPDQQFGFVSGGVFATQAEADAYHVWDRHNRAGYQYRQAGDTKWMDLNGDGEITRVDQAYFGNKRPDHRGGMTNVVTYKGIEFKLAVDWALGHTIWDYAALRIYADSQGEDRGAALWQNGWMYEGDVTEYPRIARGEQNGPGNTQYRGGRNGWYYRKGDYLAFRELSVAYTLPSTILDRLNFISNAKVNLTARNLGWIKNRQLRNPEEVDGEDRYMYPVPFILTGGIVLSF